MRKSLVKVALTVALTAAMSSQAFAAYIVAPPENASAAEYVVWEWQEAKRWEERLIDENAETIKQIADPVERINAVVKAVASYSTYIGKPGSFSRGQRFEAGNLDADTMAYYCVLLGKEVGLDVQLEGNMYSTQLSATNYCIIDGVDYWFDAAYYDMDHDDKYLAHKGQPEWVMTQEQLNAATPEAEPILSEIGDTFITENGQVVTLVN